MGDDGIVIVWDDDDDIIPRIVLGPIDNDGGATIPTTRSIDRRFPAFRRYR